MDGIRAMLSYLKNFSLKSSVSTSTKVDEPKVTTGLYYFVFVIVYED